MTEEIAATPGWVEDRLDEVFAELPGDTRAAQDAYAGCLAGRKAPAAPSDMLGAEFEGCRSTLRRALMEAGVEAMALDRVDRALEALEAEVAGQS